MRWLVAKREAALEAAAPNRYGTRADRASRRRLRFWDFLLDVVSLNGRI